MANLREYLWNYFRLPYEHYGFENAKSTDEIVKVSMDYCQRKNFISRADKVNIFFRDQFLIKCVSPILSQLKIKYNKVLTDEGEVKKTKSKWYLRGFECEKNKDNFYYYYPRPNEELERIRERDHGSVEAKKNNFKIREIERKEYIKQQLPAHQKELLDEHKEVA